MGARPFRKQRPLLSLGSSWLLACAAWYLLYSHWPGTQRTGSAAPPPLPWIDAFTPPRLHGRVTKHGPVVGLSQLAALYQGQEDPDPQQAVQLYYPKAWRKERLHGGRPEPPGRLCAVMWNDDLKVIFVKNVKAAGSTLVTYFKDCAMMGPNDGPFEYRCLRTLNFGNATEVSHLLRVWREYFVFSWGRNVLQRAVSQYRYLAQFVAPDCVPDWDRYCSDPYLMGDACERAVHNASAGPCCDSGTSSVHQYLHVMPQAPCMVTEDGELALDFLGRVEAFEEDFAALLAHLNARPGLPRLPPPGKEMETINVQTRCASGGDGSNQAAPQEQGEDEVAAGSEGCGVMQYFSGRHAACLDGVLAVYAEDVRLLL